MRISHRHNVKALIRLWPEFHPGYVRIIQCKALMAQNLPKRGCVTMTLRCILPLLPTTTNLLSLATDAKDVRINV